MRLALASLLFLTGCATQRFHTAHPAEVVAACVKVKWERCGMFDFKIPVELEKTPGGWFVGISVATINKLPSGWKHGTYEVWTEAEDADGGSKVVYRRAYQIFHRCLDRAVKECR